MDEGDEKPWRLRALAAVVCCLSFTWFALSVVPLSDSNPGGMLRILVAFAGIVVGIGQFLVSVTCVFWPSARAWRRGIAGFVACVLIQVAWATSLPFQVRLWASDSALQQYAANVPAGTRVNGGSAGWFDFDWVYRSDNGAVYFVTGYGFKDEYGFVYLPPGAAAHQPVEHVYGPWYRFDRW